VRVSVVSVGGLEYDLNGLSFDYAEPFQWRWKDNFLHSSTIELDAGKPQEVIIGHNGSNYTFTVSIPIQGAGVAGLLIADPCVSSPNPSITSAVACTFGKKFETLTRTPALINAFLEQGIDYWGILGDNFYDRTGETTRTVFESLSNTTKSKLLVTVPGNHDYWILGDPAVSTTHDQYGYGFYQWYGQDVKAAEHILPKSTGAPYNFSVNPSSGHILFGGNLPSLENAFFYNQIGNTGIVGYSGAHKYEETKPYLQEACDWAVSHPEIKLLVLVGHWDDQVLGCEDDMDVPSLYDQIKALPGCKAFDDKQRLKFVMGHTHCNVPHPHGRVNTGFMVAGQGMEV